MVEKFIKDGYVVARFDEFSDAYVINTCTVTNMGDKKWRQMIRRARHLNEEAFTILKDILTIMLNSIV